MPNWKPRIKTQDWRLSGSIGYDKPYVSKKLIDGLNQLAEDDGKKHHAQDVYLNWEVS